MQKQSKFSRINTFIPVPSPTLGEDNGKTEPAKFAISITLLTPGLPIPYSTPKPTPDNPDPTPQYAARDMATSRSGSGVNPYIPMTNSENETVAAYIYFDGRGKEEVATLLRPGEETWVNSRWVQVPDSEGGGLAEREFLFREVGLERWLNGLDLQGHDAEDRLAKRRQKFERRRRKQRAEGGEAAMGDADGKGPRDALRYGNNEASPVEAVLDDDSMSDSDDEFPEAAGQIKVAMFRVIASGEIKKGEYSPQFGAHDDDDELDGGNQNGVDADVEHTTSFAKPKTLDPKTISTQTVTGIDGPEKPYATFTFYYRGDKQLQKMGVLSSSKPQVNTPAVAKRRSAQLDFSKLGPLKTTGTVGFSTFRDSGAETAKRRRSRKKSNGSHGAMDEDSDEDSDDDEPEILGKMEDIDEKDVKTSTAPEDAQFTGELAEGVDRIKLKRQRSADPEDSTPTDPRSPSLGANLPANSPPTASAFGGGLLSAVPSLLAQSLPDDSAVGSPLKKQRAGTLGHGAGRPPQPSLGVSQPQASTSAPAVPAPVTQSVEIKDEEEEEL